MNLNINRERRSNRLLPIRPTNIQQPRKEKPRRTHLVIARHSLDYVTDFANTRLDIGPTRPEEWLNRNGERLFSIVRV